MSDMVYLIVSGHYSDFQVHAAYTAKPRAEEVVSRLNGFGLGVYDRFRVQEVPLDAEPRPRKRRTVFIALSDGEEIDRFCYSLDPWSNEPSVRGIEDEDDNDTVVGESTRSYDDALKAAQDRRTRILARREGVA
jgi:hypothetical protein